MSHARGGYEGVEKHLGDVTGRVLLKGAATSDEHMLTPP